MGTDLQNYLHIRKFYILVSIMGENGTRHRNRLKVVNKSYDALKATV